MADSHIQNFCSSVQVASFVTEHTFLLETLRCKVALDQFHRGHSFLCRYSPSGASLSKRVCSEVRING